MRVKRVTIHWADGATPTIWNFGSPFDWTFEPNARGFENVVWSFESDGSKHYVDFAKAKQIVVEEA